MIDDILIASCWKATLVLIVAFCLCGVLRRKSASARHLVWAAAFVALLLLPLLSRLTPDWTVTVPVVVAHSSAPVSGPPVARVVKAPTDWIALGWLLGAALVLARFAIGTARIGLTTRRASAMPIAGVGGDVPVLDAGAGAMPMTWGIFRPVVLLPTEAADWPEGRLRSVLSHELAHVARRDCLTLAISELALALYWFHPLAWWAASRMRREREQACDDRVLADGIVASDYAGDLIHVARGRSDASRFVPAMARGSHLEARLKAILDPRTSRRGVTRKMAGFAAAAALLILAPLASLRLHGQGAGLNGVIYDSSGGVVPAATVSVVNAETGATQAISADAAGAYSLPSLAAGRYQVMISQPGFAVLTYKSVAVPGSLDAVLPLGSLSESMVVSGKRPQSSRAATAPHRIRVGGNVQAARLVTAPRPVYPAHAESAGVQGKVLLRAVIRADGGVMALTVLSAPDPELADAAVQAVQQWRYQPTLLNGQPVEVVSTISVDFRLDQ